MAKVTEIDEQGWADWVASRPPEIQDLCRKFPPDRLYLLKSSNHRVTLYSYSEDGTLTVNVTGKYNSVMIDRQVFGVTPDDLEECDLPEEGEVLGTVYTDPEEADAYLKTLGALRAAENS